MPQLHRLENLWTPAEEPAKARTLLQRAKEKQQRRAAVCFFRGRSWNRGGGGGGTLLARAKPKCPKEAQNCLWPKWKLFFLTLLEDLFRFATHQVTLLELKRLFLLLRQKVFLPLAGYCLKSRLSAERFSALKTNGRGFFESIGQGKECRKVARRMKKTP